MQSILFKKEKTIEIEYHAAQLDPSNEKANISWEQLPPTRKMQ